MYYIERDEFDNYFVVDTVRMIHEPLPLTWYYLTESKRKRSRIKFTEMRCMRKPISKARQYNPNVN
ncbi:hypothetical protein RB43ORF267w [Escherichia phage RB43]|uniref:Uncharacterized protein n=1 Tax=Escherichia phage RB43 TaxID=2887182 RepID=Q56BD2_9CAUD|nr:hypothetical protein RB43ORF267w [Escherichia phage RB43]AAX78789.1 hypothetical protein RB43ORF267w [Escherichia phage RB43]